MEKENKTEKGLSESRKLTCICCPVGCELTVSQKEGGTVTVTGNRCPRGAAYGEKEVTNPTRIVTSTVRAAGGRSQMVPVKTASEIPKEKIMECIRELSGVTITLPIKAGDVVLENVAGTGANIVATRSVE